MNKKAMELSVTVIVLLIISIIIFGFGIYMLKKIFFGANEIQASLEQQAQSQIEQMLKEENALVAVPFGTKQATRGGSTVFGVGIRNTGDSVNKYTIVTAFDNAVTPDGSSYILSCGDNDCSYVNTNWLGAFAVQPYISLAPKNFKALSILVKVGNKINDAQQTPSGNYQFLVCVFETPDEQEPLFSTDDCTLDVFKNNPSKFYSSKVYPITVTVK